jgi:hypothetical protein
MRLKNVLENTRPHGYDPEVVKEFMSGWQSSNYQILEDGVTVAFFDDIYILQGDLYEAGDPTRLPCRFSTCNGEFRIHADKLQTLEGCPRQVAGDFILKCDSLKTLEGGPRVVAGVYRADCLGLTSLKGMARVIDEDALVYSESLTSCSGIHKDLKLVHGGKFAFPDKVSSSILGFLMINKLMEVRAVSISGGRSVKFPSHRAATIVTRHLQGDRDVLECQEELITAGLKEFAKL